MNNTMAEANVRMVHRITDNYKLLVRGCASRQLS